MNLSSKINALLSDTLREKYGDIHFEIVSQESDYRVSVIRDKENIVRLLAISVFSNNYTGDLLEAHKQIVLGGLIGETIREHNFDFIRNIKAYFSINSPHLFNNSLNKSSSGQFSEIVVRKKDCDTDIAYCSLCEIFFFESEIGESRISLEGDLFEKIKAILTLANIETDSLVIN